MEELSSKTCEKIVAYLVECADFKKSCHVAIDNTHTYLPENVHRLWYLFDELDEEYVRLHNKNPMEGIEKTRYLSSDTMREMRRRLDDVEKAVQQKAGNRYK